MHQYLKAIGFGNLKGKKELEHLLEDTQYAFTQHDLVTEKDRDFCEYQKEYGPGVGIALCGDMELGEDFQQEYYYPYLVGTGVTSYADIFVERRIDREAYVGICEDSKIGINLIFFIQNIMEYKEQNQKKKDALRYKSVTLSGLCNEGMVLLPIRKDQEQEKKQKEEVHNRRMLLSAAKNGDPEAMESLTLDDIDTYSKVSRRLITEDVFSIVETYIMPYGVECDCYSIMGEIMELYQIENDLSKEQLYIMKLQVNDLVFDICVPVSGVTGEPGAGRRFKGNIWLQGRINF